MELPKTLEPVLADIRHQTETGKHQWHEVVYYDGAKWCCYAGSDTFKDGESVKQWKYVKDCLPIKSRPFDLLVMPKTADRPKIENFMPKEAGLTTVHKEYNKSLILYNYMNALDAYIDELESKFSEIKIK